MKTRLEEIKNWLATNVPLFMNEAKQCNFEDALGCRWLNLGEYSVMLDFWEEDAEDAEYPYYMAASVRKTDSSYFAWDWEMPSEEDGSCFCWTSIGEMKDYTIDAKFLLDYIERFEQQNAEIEDEFDWAA